MSTAIIGYGHTAFSREPGPTTVALATQAVERAIEDAGLSARDIDGVILGQSETLSRAELTLAFRHTLDLGNLSHFSLTEGKGTTVLQMIQHAALAVGAGLAKRIVCVFADTPIKAGVTGGAAFARASNVMNIDGWEAAHGCFGAIGPYALAASAYLHRRGADERALGHYAIACRRWAASNPLAFFRQGLDLEGYLDARLIVEPFRILDCALPVNGAAAFIVAQSADAATAVCHIVGMGQGHGRYSMVTGAAQGEPTGARHAADMALRMARAEHRDVSSCQLYDAFSFSGLAALEEFGFCAPGSAPEFVGGGETGPGGALPVNTGGGHLSGFYLQGVTPLLEALIQIRGEGGARQVANDLVFVSNSGGCLEYHATLAISPHRRLG
ncbi:MAG: thiolase family protein [Sphingomonas sp.]|uniref:thiolase family protein n=1 Tax=Sphingomonas sp. TaxID=28214 RepID=UPI00261D4FC4|nr:thiolase family protein [Sphingomonas sp.]MDK2766088.1 thiolase family protein [Sphingomonas sp.]